MRIVRWVAAAALLFVAAHMAMADSAGDPKIYTVGGGGSTVLGSTNDPKFALTYTYGVTPTFSCFDGSTCFQENFINNSGVAWTGISLAITSVGGSITQSSFTADNSLDPYFVFSSLTFNDLGQAVLSFYGTDATHPGILPATSCSDGECSGPYYYPPASEFGIPLYDFGILADVTDAQSPGDSFTAKGSAAVPEPRSIFLLLAGAALLGLYLNKRV
jgi:hypothetical protein